MEWLKDFGENISFLSRVSSKDIDWQTGTDQEKIAKLQVKMIEKDLQIEVLIERINKLELRNKVRGPF